VVSCAQSDGTVAVDAEWNLTCPTGSAVGCGPLAIPAPCLSEDAEGASVPGRRSIVGSRGDVACTGDPIDVTCEAVEQSDGTTFITLKAHVGDNFAFELDARLGEGSVGESCNVTIIEDGAMYEYGGCVAAPEPTSMELPCALSNISTEGGNVVFDLECDPHAILSRTSALGFNVGAVGGGPTTIRFSNCTGI
jgi:hypothetical protein